MCDQNKYTIYKSIDKQASNVQQGHLIIFTSVFAFASRLVIQIHEIRVKTLQIGFALEYKDYKKIINCVSYVAGRIF